MKTAKYMGSFPKVEKCPKGDRPEYAFIGRSNVGKSSLINMLTGRNSLALVSKKPGKTQMINFFGIDEESWYLVDLPGYGYAKVSKKHRASFGKMIEFYMIHRRTMQCAFVLIDCNIKPQKIDIEFINFLGQNRVPFVIVFTKSDKTKPLAVQANIKAFQEEMLQYWDDLPQQFVTSAKKETGRDEVLEFIEGVNANFVNPE